MNLSKQTEGRLNTIVEIIVSLGLMIVIFLALVVYGQYWPRQWQKRVPMTNMRGVERAIGKPLKIVTNIHGTVLWDYTRWWSGSAKVYFKTNGDFYRIFTEW
jgi:hypothetical protein